MGLDTFTKAKNLPHLDEEEKQILKKYNQFYLEFLERLGHQKEYEAILFAHNKEAIKVRLKQNEKWKKIIQKDLEQKKLEEQTCRQRELNQQNARLTTVPLSKENHNEETINEYCMVQKIENLKKEYKENSTQKEKTHGIEDPQRVIEEIIPTIIKRPLVRIEELISSVSLKIFKKLFGPYEKCPIMDHSQKIHPNHIKTLMDALSIPYSFSSGKGDHTKETISFEDAEGHLQEYMIIIPYRVPGIHPHYIKCLREIFISMDLYPKDIEDSLFKAGLLN